MSGAAVSLHDDREIALFEAAAALPESEQATYLQTACPDSLELRRCVQDRLQWERRMNGFLQKPVFRYVDTVRPFAIGDVACERFEIRREIAEGGMSIVYEAFDLKTGRPVALKCPSIAFRRRLRDELRSALLVTHQNICRLYEVHSTLSRDGRTIEFLTMEYLEGSTLAARMSCSPLSMQEISVIAKQLCAGLSEAHVHDVIHGDLKPNNIVLAAARDGGIRAVITDFGLARAVDSGKYSPPLNASLRGAVDYIAPERWQGEPISKASDIFAIGVIFFEMLSGQRPSQLGVQNWTKIPRPWRNLVRRCLAEVPEQRIRDAQTVAKYIPTKHPIAAWSFAALALCIASLAVGWASIWTPTIPEVIRLAILAPETDVPTSALGNGVAADLSDRLGRLDSKGKPFVIIPADKSIRYHVGTVEAAGKVLGATHALGLKLRGRGVGFEIEGWIADVPSRRTLRAFRRVYESGGGSDILQAIASVTSSALRRNVIAEGMANAPKAYADYAEGVYFLRHARDVGRARSALERIAPEDIDDIWVQLRLAQIGLLDYTRTKAEVALRLTQDRIDRCREIALKSPLSTVVLASLDDATGRPERAIEDYEHATAIDEHRGAAWRGLAAVHHRLGRTSEAQTSWNKAIEVEPGYFQPRMDLGVMYYTRGQYISARDQFASVTKTAPGLAIPHYDLAAVLVDLGDFERAEQEYHQSLAIEEDSDTLTGIGALLAYRGRHAESVHYYERAVDSGPEDPLRLSNLADAYRRTVRPAGAKATYLRVVAVAERILAAESSDSPTRSLLAYALARLQRRGEALRQTHVALVNDGKSVKVLKRAILTFEVLGLRERTLGLLDRAPNSLIAELQRYPDLDELVASGEFSRFRKLATTKQGYE